MANGGWRRTYQNETKMIRRERSKKEEKQKARKDRWWWQ